MSGTELRAMLKHEATTWQQWAHALLDTLHGVGVVPAPAPPQDAVPAVEPEQVDMARGVSELPTE